jgi:hypothetical protein
MSVKGTMVAAMVAGLFAGTAPLLVSTAHAAGKVKCEGGNACKGKSACKTAASSCNGTNACKGKGWVETKDEAECKKLGGKVSAAK